MNIVDGSEDADPASGRKRRLRIDRGEPDRETNHYFADESGDLSFFGRNSALRLGSPGCTKTFMLGMARIDNPAVLTAEMEFLRSELLRDSRYNHIASMQPSERKTALFFHAKDDHPLVRERVFDLLARQQGLCILVAIRRKQWLLSEMMRGLAPGTLPVIGNPQRNKVYENLVGSLSCGILHRADTNKFIFAQRGKSSRTVALHKAIGDTQEHFVKRCRTAMPRPYEISVALPHEHGGLQAVDYLLWALQRVYERNDWSAYEKVSDLFAHIHDIDAKRGSPPGIHYCRSKESKRLTREKANALWRATPTIKREQRHEADVRLPESAQKDSIDQC